MARLLKIAALCLLFFAGAGIGFLIMMGFFTPGSSVLAPGVEGLSADDARLIAEKSGLEFKVQEERYDTRKERGLVVKQNPSAGMNVKKGQTLYVTVSKGIEKVIVEDFSSLTLDNAQLSLQKNGLRLRGVSYIWSADAAQTVVSQSPAPGAVVPKESDCCLLVSQGGRRPLFVAPDLRGKEARSAARSLFEYGIATSAGDAGAEGARVTGQKPLPGFPVDATMTMNLGVGR